MIPARQRSVGGLAGAIRADEPEYLAGRDMEGNVVDGCKGAVLACKACNGDHVQYATRRKAGASGCHLTADPLPLPVPLPPPPLDCFAVVTPGLEALAIAECGERGPGRPCGGRGLRLDRRCTERGARHRGGPEPGARRGAACPLRSAFVRRAGAAIAEDRVGARPSRWRGSAVPRHEPEVQAVSHWGH